MKDQYIKIEWIEQETTETLKRLPPDTIVTARVPAEHGLRTTRMPVSEVLKLQYALVER